MQTEHDPDRGIIRLTRTQLEAIVGGDERALDPDDDLGRELVELGVVRQGRVDEHLRPILDALRRPTARFGLRVERAATARRPVERHRGWVGHHAVVTVSGGAEADDVQDVRLSARASSAARVVGRLLALGPARVVSDLPTGALPWDAVMASVREPGCGWAAEALGPQVPVRLLHLRWTDEPQRPATTVMALLASDGAGIVEAVGTDAGFRLVTRSPTEVWTGLCALAGRRRGA